MRHDLIVQTAFRLVNEEEAKILYFIIKAWEADSVVRRQTKKDVLNTMQEFINKTERALKELGPISEPGDNAEAIEDRFECYNDED